MDGPDLGVMRYKEDQPKIGSSSSSSGSNSSSSRRLGSQTSDSRIRRASYYVWFLGAEECRGIRGSEVVQPVLRYLLEREREREPDKVTLQVSGRGIKLLHQGMTSRGLSAVHVAAAVDSGGGGGGGGARHFIPCGALTHVQQEEPPDDDIVSTVLLIYNPVTRCPVHVHAYRCDSTETASVLRQHLNQLLTRPEQQEKLAALEGRLASRGLLPFSSRGSDGGASSGGSSVSSGGGGGSRSSALTSGGGPVGSGGDRIATLYDSLAAELREKLGTSRGGGGGGGGRRRGGEGTLILLPPKDYNDGGIMGRSKRHSGGTRKESLLQLQEEEEEEQEEEEDNHDHDSALSSGIGSDVEEPPSPTQHKQQHLREPFSHDSHRQSSSDEEWTGASGHEARGGGFEGPTNLLQLQSPWRGEPTPKLPASRQSHPHRERGRRRKQQQQQQQSQEEHKHLSPTRIFPLSPRKHKSPPLRVNCVRRESRKLKERSISPVSPQDRFYDAREKFLSLERQRSETAVATTEGSTTPHTELISRSTSWEVAGAPKGYQSQGHRGRERRRRRGFGGSRDDLADAGHHHHHGSRDALMRDRRSRDHPRDYDEWRRTPDVWEYRSSERALSPMQVRARTPVRGQRTRSPECVRAKSMHDLSQQQRSRDDDADDDDDDERRRYYEPQRHSSYDPLDDGLHHERRRSYKYSSSTNLRVGGPPSLCSSRGSSPPPRGTKYNELPEHQRFPGLDRSSARPDPLDARSSKRTFDYPVNGGHAPIHITRAHHDDYRKFRYDHGNNNNNNGPLPRPMPPVSAVHY